VCGDLSRLRCVFGVCRDVACFVLERLTLAQGRKFTNPHILGVCTHLRKQQMLYNSLSLEKQQELYFGDGNRLATLAIQRGSALSSPTRVEGTTFLGVVIHEVRNRTDVWYRREGRYCT
jgi:hypothetical protein